MGVQIRTEAVLTDCPELTQELGKIIGANSVGGEVYLLVGQLGAGKTTLTQGILWGLGVDDHARSPTFVLISEYEGRLSIYHMDLYRLDEAAEVEDLGIDEYLTNDGVCVVEWADKFPTLFDAESMTIRLETLGDRRRRIVLQTESESYEPVLEAIRNFSSREA